MQAQQHQTLALFPPRSKDNQRLLLSPHKSSGHLHLTVSHEKFLLQVHLLNRLLLPNLHLLDLHKGSTVGQHQMGNQEKASRSVGSLRIGRPRSGTDSRHHAVPNLLGTRELNPDVQHMKGAVYSDMLHPTE